jgi:electron transfer flavoprotein alpha subunit
MQDPPPAPAQPPPTLALPERAQPRPRRVELLEGAAGEVAARIDELVRGRGEVVVAAGRGAGHDLEPYRRLAERYGGRFAVSRPQVEAARATRADLVGASSQVVAPDVYLAFGISGAIPHLVGMAESATVVAINTDRTARIFEYADYGALVDAEQVARQMCDGPPLG